MSRISTQRTNRVIAEVSAELERAVTFFPSMRSAHEGYAILLEEVDELWETIRYNKSSDANDKQRKEAIQVAAMAMRFVLDISDNELYRNER